MCGLIYGTCLTFVEAKSFETLSLRSVLNRIGHASIKSLTIIVILALDYFCTDGSCTNSNRCNTTPRCHFKGSSQTAHGRTCSPTSNTLSNCTTLIPVVGCPVGALVFRIPTPTISPTTIEPTFYFVAVIVIRKVGILPTTATRTTTTASTTAATKGHTAQTTLAVFILCSQDTLLDGNCHLACARLLVVSRPWHHEVGGVVAKASTFIKG